MNFFSTASDLILDTLFPIHCLSCRQGGKWLCDVCFSKIQLSPYQVCPYCEREITERGGICLKCRQYHLAQNKIIPLDSLIVSSYYTNKDLAKLIHYFKYAFIEDLREPLGNLLLKSLIENNINLPDLIIPIPLHHRRLRWRGFNQSELLAKLVGQKLAPGLNIPVATEIIYRKKYTTPQMSVKNYKERKKNVSKVFAVDKNFKKSIEDKTILLIDDIATTGATLEEAGRLLKQNGARNVIGAVIARQEYKK